MTNDSVAHETEINIEIKICKQLYYNSDLTPLKTRYDKIFSEKLNI